MGVLGVLVVFAITWWLVFFMALPFGVRAPDEPEPGHSPSAPENPRLALKAAITTVIAASLTGLAFVAIEYDVIAFREMVE